MSEACSRRIKLRCSVLKGLSLISTCVLAWYFCQFAVGKKKGILIVTNESVEIRQEIEVIKVKIHDLKLDRPTKSFLDVLHGKPIILSRQNGRLGNALFQYAVANCMAQQTGHVTLIYTDNDLLRIFSNITALKTEADDFHKVLPSISAHLPATFDKFLRTKLEYIQDVQLSGYFQSWKYFIPCKDRIRSQFTIHHSLRSASETLIATLTQNLKNTTKEGDNSSFIVKNFKSLVYIGVHIRRGDMATEEKVTLGYTTAPVSYIEGAMNLYRKKYPGLTVFVVISDDMLWCRENLSQSNRDIIFAGTDNQFLDFATLVNCKHSIITTGSFGWWAGWLAGGRVVYYKNFPAKDTKIGRHYRRKDYYLPHWIAME